MRKLNMTVVVLAAAILLGGCGASAGNKETPQSTASAETAQETEMTGAYEVNKDLKAAKLPEDAQKAFDQALDGLTGGSYEPIALLGKQAVAGTNYAILCKETPSYPDAEEKLEVLTVYENIDSDAQLISSCDFDLAHYAGADAELIDDGAAGAFEVNTEYEAQEIPADLKNVFADTTSEPVAVLGSQIVAGTNYAVLCMEDKDSENPKWSVETVYEDLNGKTEITSDYQLNVGNFIDQNTEAIAIDEDASAEPAESAKTN